MYIRIKEKSTGLYVGFGSKDVTMVYDLFHVVCTNEIYVAKSYQDAQVICDMLNKLPEDSSDFKVKPLFSRWSNWEFEVERSSSWYPENKG